MPPGGHDKRESIRISYVAVDEVLTDIANLTAVRGHEPLLHPKEPWEAVKLGGGAPQVRTPSGWLVTYHGPYGLICGTSIGAIAIGTTLARASLF